MRLSVHRNDSGYEEWSKGAKQIEIFCDGEKLDNCHTADEEKGEALCYVFLQEAKYKGYHVGEFIEEGIQILEWPHLGQKKFTGKIEIRRPDGTEEEKEK